MTPTRRKALLILLVVGLAIASTVRVVVLATGEGDRADVAFLVLDLLALTALVATNRDVL